MSTGQEGRHTSKSGSLKSESIAIVTMMIFENVKIKIIIRWLRRGKGPKDGALVAGIRADQTSSLPDSG